MNIYVGNLPYSVTEDELRTAFAAFGEVSSVNVITDKFSGQSKGFGFVEHPWVAVTYRSTRPSPAASGSRVVVVALAGK